MRPNESRRIETKSRKGIITAVQVAIAVLVVAGVAWLAFKLVGYNQAQQVYRSIQSEYVANSGGVIASENPVDFNGLREKYPAVVAWVQMDDVDLSYPEAVARLKKAYTEKFEWLDTNIQTY